MTIDCRALGRLVLSDALGVARGYMRQSTALFGSNILL